MFPRNHGKTQHRKIIARIIVKNTLDEVIRMLVKFGDAAIFSDTQISKAALELTELEFELLALRQENIELKARLDTNRAQVKAMATEKRRRWFENAHRRRHSGGRRRRCPPGCASRKEDE